MCLVFERLDHMKNKTFGFRTQIDYSEPDYSQRPISGQDRLSNWQFSLQSEVRYLDNI
jgi:hypothetical protein